MGQEMTPERLLHIRRVYIEWSNFGTPSTFGVADMTGELLTHVDELTQQRDDARRIAIDSGIFQNIGGTAYLPDVHLNDEDKWRADPVAWEQVQQR